MNVLPLRSVTPARARVVILTSIMMKENDESSRSSRIPLEVIRRTAFEHAPLSAEAKTSL